MKAFDEKTIIEKIGDPQKRKEAFEEIVRQFSQSLYWNIRRMVFYHDDADDVLQNTLMKVWMNLAMFRGESKLSTWLFRVAYNETITFLNHRKETISLDSQPNDPDNENSLENTISSNPYFDGDEAETLLQEAIAELPPKQKAVFVMKYYDELKYEEMAAVTGTSTGALKASYHQAVKKIESYLERHESL
jgi:RNA polymerase sigma-70 factor (ECF subfamily)